MPPESFFDSTIGKLLISALGALSSLTFLREMTSWFDRASMFIGGVLLSFFGSAPTAEWLAAQKASGLIQTLIALFGMAIVSKGHAVIALVDAKEIAGKALDWLFPNRGPK